jgi:hypothetical protein
MSVRVARLQRPRNQVNVEGSGEYHSHLALRIVGRRWLTVSQHERGLLAFALQPDQLAEAPREA